MIERNDQGKNIEVTAPLHSREWCEAVWPNMIKYQNNVSVMFKRSEGAIDWSIMMLNICRIHPNSEEFEGIMAGCSEEFREAVRGKMNEKF